VGYTLFVLKNNKLEAVKIKSIEIKDDINDVYNLKVDKLHNYFAEGVLCHNKPPSNPPAQ
jgi:intein/homing endonuclease